MNMIDKKNSSQQGRDDHNRLLSRHYPPRYLAEILLILLLSILDAWFTVYLLGHGAREMNPVMAFFMQYGRRAFFGVKYGLTVFGVFILLLNQKEYLAGTRIRRKFIFHAIAMAYAITIVWELYLILFRIH